MKKRILSLILAVMLILCLGACTQEENPGNSEGPGGEPTVDLSGMCVTYLYNNRGSGLVMSYLGSDGQLAAIGIHDMENFLSPNYYVVHYENGKPSALSFCPTLPGSYVGGKYEWTAELKEENGSFITVSAKNEYGEASKESVTITCFESGAIESVNILSDREEFRFNEKGQLLHMTAGDYIYSYEFSGDGSSCTYTFTEGENSVSIPLVYAGLSAVSASLTTDSISLAASMTYDEKGLLTGYTAEEDGDKIVATVSLQPDMRMPSYTIEQYQDGAVRLKGTMTLEYNAAGLITVLEQTAEYADGIKRHQKVLVSYDEEGRRLQNSTYMNSQSGELYLYSESKWAYDDRGNEISKSNANYKEDGSLDQKHSYTYTYDEKDQRIKTVYVKDPASSDFSKRETEYSYDLNGNQTQIRTFEYDGAGALTIQSTMDCEYNDSCQIIRKTEVAKDESGVQQYRNVYSYEYDAAGNKIKETLHSYNGEDALEYGYIEHYEYDENDKITNQWTEHLGADGKPIV